MEILKIDWVQPWSTFSGSPHLELCLSCIISSGSFQPQLLVDSVISCGSYTLEKSIGILNESAVNLEVFPISGGKKERKIKKKKLEKEKKNIPLPPTWVPLN